MHMHDVGNAQLARHACRGRCKILWLPRSLQLHSLFGSMLPPPVAPPGLWTSQHPQEQLQQQPQHTL